MTHHDSTHQHRQFDAPLVIGGVLWLLLGATLAAVFAAVPERPYAPAIALGLATAALGVYLASPRLVTCRSIHRAASDGTTSH